MEKVICEVPGLSDFIREQNFPLSPVVRAGDFVFVSGLPPLDLDTGECGGPGSLDSLAALVGARNECGHHLAEPRGNR